MDDNSRTETGPCRRAGGNLPGRSRDLARLRAALGIALEGLQRARRRRSDVISDGRRPVHNHKICVGMRHTWADISSGPLMQGDVGTGRARAIISTLPIVVRWVKGLQAQDCNSGYDAVARARRIPIGAHFRRLLFYRNLHCQRPASSSRVSLSFGSEERSQI